MPEDGGSVFIEEWCLCVGSGEGEGKKTGRISEVWGEAWL